MQKLYRRLTGTALAGATVAVAAGSYLREEMNPLAVLPTLATAEPWFAAQIPLTIIAVLSLLLAASAAGWSRRFPLYRTLFIQAAGTVAAVATYSYDACADAGMAWLPQFGGCHCWLTGAAAFIGAGLAAAAIFIAGLFTLRLITYIRVRERHLRRRLQRQIARRTRLPASRVPAALTARLLAFRGPPRFFTGQAY